MDGTAAPKSAEVVVNVVDKDIKADISVDTGNSAAEADKTLDTIDEDNNDDNVSFTLWFD
jgi:hypothetical protein